MPAKTGSRDAPGNCRGNRPPVEQLVHISDFYLSPGGSSERVFCIAPKLPARGLSIKARRCGGKRGYPLLELPTAEAFGQLDRGDIHDAKTIVALMWLRAKLGSEGG